MDLNIVGLNFCTSADWQVTTKVFIPKNLDEGSRSAGQMTCVNLYLL